MTTILDSVHGRINDLDSHLQVAVSQWGEVFGEQTARMGAMFIGNKFFDDHLEPARDQKSIWHTKGSAAPGASTPEGRLARTCWRRCIFRFRII